MTGTVLLVEDNPITQKLVRYALESSGISIRIASDASSAREALAAGDIELVLLDLVLPDTDGFSLAEAIREDERVASIPLLAFTGLISSRDEARIAAVGFDDVVTKPIEPSRLVATVKAHLPDGTDIDPRQGAGRAVIVADDDAVQRKLTSFRLRRAGFDVRTARDGREALELARSARPDAILSDVLMPRLDGFELCRELARDPALGDVPVVLVTNSYVAEEDRRLARRVGAADLVLRTPDLRDAVAGLWAALDRPPPSELPDADAALDRAHLERVLRQLERQLSVNQGLTRRCALLSTKLSVLSGIASTLADRGNLEDTLRHVLAACFDAAGISVGALYLDAPGPLDRRILRVGMSPRWSETELEQFFGEPELLREAIREQATVVIPTDVGGQRGKAILERAGVDEILLTPVGLPDEPLGALLTVVNGTYLPLRDRRQFAEAVAGQIAQALRIAGAFSQTVAARREAQEQAVVLESILGSIADGVVVADPQGRITHVNAAGQRLLGHLDFPGLDPARWSDDLGIFGLDGELLPSSALPLARAIRGETVERTELLVRNEQAPDGLWLEVSARPLDLPDGRRLGGVAAFRDVTRERAAREQLMLADRMASLGLMAAGVAHEINNPLAAVLANLALLHDALEADAAGERTAPAEWLSMLGDAREAATRVRLIARDLKTFARKDEEPDATADLARVVESSVRMAHNEVRHRAVLETQLESLPPVRGSESRLGQVVLNLLVNAAQAMPDGDIDANRIRVHARRDGAAHAVLEVSDTGAGMDEATRRRVFTPFFTTKERGVGTGSGSRSATGSSTRSAARSGWRARSARAPRSPCACPSRLGPPPGRCGPSPRTRPRHRYAGGSSS